MRQHRLTVCIVFAFALAVLFQNARILQGNTFLSTRLAWSEATSKDRRFSNASDASDQDCDNSLWNETFATKECWRVDNICHSSHRWFYDPRSINRNHFDVRQPPFSLHLHGRKRGYKQRYSTWSNSSSMFLGRPKTLTVRAPRTNHISSSTAEEEHDTQFIPPSFLETCTYSLIPNHIVLQTFFNEMLGEFYGRSLTHLYHIHQSMMNSMQTGETPDSDWHTSMNLQSHASFIAQTQMYLHVRSFTEHGKLLDSHHLFTDAFRLNPLLSFNSLLDYTGCRCLKRLFLCGYTSTNGKQVGNVRGVFSSNSSVVTEIEPAPQPLYLHNLISFQMRELRERLVQATISKSPFLQEDIANFRAAAVATHRPSLMINLTASQLQYDVHIIGLTQRNGRRRWLNLDEVLRRCNTEWFIDGKTVVCVEINVENNDVNPVRQVVMHAACDMLFGIHGAQLTEAIWMKDGSVVVELMPWIPEGMRNGAWTRSTDKPTPLGAIFTDSKLNHIGYRLERASAPYCWNETEPDESKKCFRKHLWDNRDFQVEPDIIHDMITKFAPSNTPKSCDEIQERSGDHVYVLYNVLCKQDSGTRDAASVHHFYWPLEQEQS